MATALTGVAALVVVPNAAHHAITIGTGIVNGSDQTLTQDTRYVLWSVEGADIRVTFDGSDPVNGHLLVENSHGTWFRDLFTKARMVRAGDVNATFHATEVMGTP